MSVDAAAAKILQRAVELDTNKRYTESMVCYQEGIQLLIDLMKGENDDKRAYFKKKIEEYMKRAEKIKEIINNLKQQGKYCEEINIENNATGYSYETVFGRFLDENVTNVKVEDPYVKSYHQCQNFLRLCELLVKKCKHLNKIELITTLNEENNNEQRQWFEELSKDLTNKKINLFVEYSTTLHDRQIILNNGWIVKLGRGLDYFKAPKSKFNLGMYDMDMRPCHQTTINIFHETTVKHF